MTMGLQDFPGSSPVTLDSREIFLRAYRHSPPAVADLVFNNLFGWQEFYDYRFSRHGDLLLVFSQQHKKMVVLPPLLLAGSMADPGWETKFSGACRAVDEHCRASGCTVVFDAFPEVYLRHLQPERYRIFPERDRYDYVYRRSDLVALPGKQYAAKRNLIRQFSRNYRYRFEPLRPENLHCVYRFIRRWKPAQDASPGSVDVATGEYRMVYRLLKHYDILQLCGGVLFVNGREVAATIASLVTDFTYADGVFATVLVHSEHALVEYKGAYQMINQLFCASLPEQIVFVNREEDLGIPGLRKAKVSYGPERLLGKSRVEPANPQELLSTGGVTHEKH